MASGGRRSARQVANGIAPVARATRDRRPGPGNEAARQVAKVVAHLRDRGWRVLGRDPTVAERAAQARRVRLDAKPGRTNPQRTARDRALAQAVVAAVLSTVDYPVVQLPSPGGTLPLITFEAVLGPRPLPVPVVNGDDNPHVENEDVGCGSGGTGSRPMRR